MTKLVCLLLLFCAASGAAAPRPPTNDPTYGLPVRPLVKAPPAPGAAAKWIWTPNTTDTQVIGLRKVFRVTGTPNDAILYATADNYFTAFVNGREVGHTAAAPGGFEWRTVHHYDVTKDLHAGPNVLAIRGENAGGAAGVVAFLQYRVGAQTHEIVTDSSWRVSGTLPTGWEKPGFDDGTWEKATIEADLTGGPWQSSMTGWPGLSNLPPYLVRMDVPVKQIVSADARRGAIAGAETLIGTGRAAMRVTPPPAATPEAESPAVMVDFGQETSGRVEITNASTAPIDVTLRYGESEDEARFGPYTGIQKLTIPAGGVGAGVDSAFRYAIVTVLSGPPSISISRIRLNMDYYPVTYRGSFDCSDPLLTKIWYTGAYTSHLCMQQDIWDAPKRDRARWMGDLQVSGEVINNVFLDRFLMEQTMDRLRADAGNPPHSHVNGIPGYSCAWVVGMADFYRHTGDSAYIAKHHDDLLQMMDYFRGELDDRGLFANKRGQWDYADWSKGFNGSGPHSLAATHFYMIRMLHDGAFLLNAIGDHAAATRYAQWADDATKAAQKYLLDPATDTFGDRWQDNAMAIESGAATPAERTAIFDKVLSHLYPETDFITPYYNNYDIFAMADSGHTQAGVDFIRSYWGGMIQEGATTFWEGYDTRWPKEHFHKTLQADNGMGYFVSLCHGWSSGPTNFLTERVLGVQSTGPGFSTVEIRPQLGDLAWASGTIPTPEGPINVKYRREGARLVTDIDLPRGVKASIHLPGKVKPTFDGRHFHAVSEVSATP
ncbi:MAG TPA: alpha-L-rhamnosidase C-terminal domain-containing protein [Armatimonadota bacterium]|nr:alpha-L-rhamnosidase C-terminal domain-containing protein [Armatimonadota bacterium]